MTQQEFVRYIGELARENMKASGVLASITAAQAILESAYGTSELATNAHNLFGMKASLSGNNWGSSWSGATYTKQTKEWSGGRYITVSAAFRKYGSDADSIKDHSDYLTGARRGSALRYAGLVGEKDPEKAATIIKSGGYATSPTYVQNLMNVVRKWNLTQYDSISEGGAKTMNIIKKTGTHGMYNGAREIRYLVIHYTAGVTSRAGSARNTAAYFASPNAGGTADFIVDDAEMVQYNPDPRTHACWAVGGAKYNNKGGRLYGQANNKNCISIEICSTNKTGRMTNANDSNYYFTDAAVSNAVTLAKYLMQQYRIPIDRVIRHYDVNGKPCPGIRGWNADSGDESAWNAFKARLGGYAAPVTPTQPSKPAATGALYRVRKLWTDASTQLGAYSTVENAKKACPVGYTVYGPTGSPIYTNMGTQQAAATTSTEYLYEVTVPDLNIRKTPNGEKTGKYTGKGRFTIVQESAGWGKLKSGAGWISLDSRYGHKVSGGSAAQAAPAKTVTTPKKAQIAVDGKLGPATIKAWQSRLGVTADGVMGPNTIRAIQCWAGSTADGVMGPNTRKAVQRKLGVTADGVWGPQTIKALQTWLNS